MKLIEIPCACGKKAEVHSDKHGRKFWIQCKHCARITNFESNRAELERQWNEYRESLEQRK